MSGRNACKVAGVRRVTGRRERMHSDDLPTKAELAEMSSRLSASNRRSRCGLPGRAPTPEYLARLDEKLRNAARAGRGLYWLSRDELDALIVRMDAQRPGQRRTNRAKRQAVLDAIAADPALADRAIAEACGVHHVTVGRIRKRQLVQSTSSRIGLDGKARRLPHRGKSESA